MPGKKFSDALEIHYGDLIKQAIADSVDVGALADAYLKHVNAAADPADVEAAQKWMASQGIDSSDELESILTELYGESYVAGTHTAVQVLTALGADVTAPKWAADVDWSKWKPGDNEAAARLAADDSSRGLAGMLDDAGITIKGIDATTMDELGRALAEGVASGENRRDLQGRMQEFVDDPDRADLIAQTESARATSLGHMDTYGENGIQTKQWLTAEDDLVDPDCEDNEADGEVALDDEFSSGDTEPPAHPGCRCVVLPVVEGSDSSQAGDGE